jgi:hypothetical protein
MVSYLAAIMVIYYAYQGAISWWWLAARFSATVLLHHLALSSVHAHLMGKATAITTFSRPPLTGAVHTERSVSGRPVFSCRAGLTAPRRSPLNYCPVSADEGSAVDFFRRWRAGFFGCPRPI